MTELEMEIKIYEELKIKVERGDYNGRNFCEELRSGDYLKELGIRRVNEELFSKVYPNVKENLLQGFEKKLEESNFLMKKLLLSVKFGTISLNKSFVDGFVPHIERLKSDLEKQKIEENQFKTLAKAGDSRKLGNQSKSICQKGEYRFPVKNVKSNRELII